MKLVTFLLFASVCWSLSQINVSPVEGINKNDSQIHALVGGLIVTHEKEFEGNIVIRNGLIDLIGAGIEIPKDARIWDCLLYTSPSPRDQCLSRMPSSA